MPLCIPIRDMKDTASFAETVLAAQAPVIVTKNGKEALVTMSPEVYEGMLREAARARLYDIVDKGLSDVENGRSQEADAVAARLREKYGL